MHLLTKFTQIFWYNSQRPFKPLCCICSITMKKTFTSISKSHLNNFTFTKNKVLVKHHTSSIYSSLRKFTTSQQRYIFWKDKRGSDSLHGVNNAQKAHDGKSLLNRYIFVNTLDQFYEDIPSGVIFDTAYADSRPGEEENRYSPVILGLHDTPGTHHDLLPILGTFAKLGCRTIAPTFPGHGETQSLFKGLDNVFSHSTIERALFVHSFINELGINRVDMVIAIGAGCYPALRLCAVEESSRLYRSMALISPWPLTRPRYDDSIELAKKIQYFWDRPMLRHPAKLFLPAWKMGRTRTAREKVTAAYLLNNLNLPEAGGLALSSALLNVPRFIVFGEHDPEVDKSLYYETVDRLDIPHANISTYRGKLDYPMLPGALVFPDGAYDLHEKNAGVICMYLLNLIKLFHPNLQL